MNGASGMTKVRLTTPNGDVETLWAEEVGRDRFRLDNSPWYAYGLSLGDVVEARRAAPGRLLDFVRVVEKSGYRTFRVTLDPGASTASRALVERLVELGCRCEGASAQGLAVGVPPAVSFEAVRAAIVGSGQAWEYADPTFEAMFPEGDPARGA